MATHIEMCNKQYGTKYNYLIPCNLYGFYDKYDPGRSHYVAALIKKLHEATEELTLFGTGKPLRQFMYAGDFAHIIKEIIEKDITESFNVATPEVKTIREIAEIAMEATGKILPITFDLSKPDGQYRKDVSIEKFRKHFPEFKFTSLKEGILRTYGHYIVKS
jgi:GDP-L-fucose synthase